VIIKLVAKVSQLLVTNCLLRISQLANLFIGIPGVCNFILFLIIWVLSFSKMLPSMKFVEDKVFIFVILCEKC